MRELKPIEKLYIQTDKPYYVSGDTLRMKAYLVNGDYLTPSPQSGLLYVELDDEQGKPAKRLMFAVADGLSRGDIPLDTADVPKGTYTLRAYTNWMRNFGEDYVFEKTISVSSAAGNPLLVKAAFKQVPGKAEGQLQFLTLDGRTFGFRDMELRVMNGRRNLSKDKIVTAVDGSIKVNFAIPEGKEPLKLLASAGGTMLTIPVNLNRPENTDLQFMPEGGQLVAGLPARVGFKALSENGKGAAVSGRIIDSKGIEVVRFAAAHAGMGSFAFTPKAGEAYSAVVNGIKRTYALPAVKLTGTTISVGQTTDSLFVILNNTADAKGTYSLIAQTHGSVCFAKAVTLNGTQRLSVSKGSISAGIVRFSLLNEGFQPLNERIAFVNRNNNLVVKISSDKQSYGIRDSILLTIAITDINGTPALGNFSLAVTDNSQVKTDSLGSNILNNLLLTSDLKGDVEEPGYYFAPDKEKELDNLLLTQGWVGYDWKEVFRPTVPYAYKPEKEFVISGKVTNAFGGPIEKSNVVIVANNPLLFKDTLTNKEGGFTFSGLFPVDAAIYKLQARNKNSKEINVKIAMDERKMPEFSPAPLVDPWYMNTDTTLLNNSKIKNAAAKALSDYRGEGSLLNEVNIKDKRIVKGSKNLNGPGEADQIIDEEELVKANKMTLLELIQQKVTGFNAGPYTPPKREYPRTLELPNYLQRDFPTFSQDDIAKVQAIVLARRHIPWRLSYKIRQQEVRFIIDGIDLDYFYNDMDEVFSKIPQVIAQNNDTKRQLFLKPYLEYFTAEDITGIEVMSRTQFARNYDISFEKDRERGGRSNAIAYLEITTRAKKGPFMQVTPGTYLFKTLPFSVAKEFYSPKYTIKSKSTAPGTDLRSTIFWAADVETDKEGKATVSFFSADKATDYTAIVEGTDMTGNLGYGSQSIRIK